MNRLLPGRMDIAVSHGPSLSHDLFSDVLSVATEGG